MLQTQPFHSVSCCSAVQLAYPPPSFLLSYTYLGPNIQLVWFSAASSDRVKLTVAAGQPPPPVNKSAAPAALDLRSVDPKVMDAARPFLTGERALAKRAST